MHFFPSQAQANGWLKNVEKSNGLRVVQYSDDSYVDALAEAISTGVSVLLENIRKKDTFIKKLVVSIDKVFSFPPKKIPLIRHSVKSSAATW